jgi:pimeloyl-ACP methyl ester carboxylesterase
LSQRSGKHPIAIGASLGGISSLLAEGTSERAGRGPILSAIVLVDVTPRVDQGGVAKVQGFMRERAVEGFATVAEAADAVAAYLPHRKRPRSLDGLKKNLRLHPDGRWRWHWDPRMVQGERSFAIDHRILEAALTEAARALTIPALLVRGGSSELVHEAHVRDFLELVPHAETIDVSGARHMVAGDNNDSFADAVLDFVGKLEGSSAGA